MRTMDTGNGDVAESLEGARTVEGSCFVEIMVNVSQRREVDDHVVTEAFPNRQEDRAAEQLPAIDEERDGAAGSAHPLQGLVNKAARIEHPAPDEGDYDDRCDDGEIRHRAEERDARNLLLDQEGQQQWQDRQQRDADDDIDECRHHGIPEHVVVPQFGVVRETDELPADEGSGVREGQDDRVDEGVEGEHDGPHDCRGHQQPRCVPAVGVHGAQSLGEVGERTTILLVPQQGGASRKITW